MTTQHRATATVAVALLVSALYCSCARAQSPAPTPTPKPTPKPPPAGTMCVVMKKSPAVRGDISSLYKGRRYYSCCWQCKTSFDRNPKKYVKTK